MADAISHYAAASTGATKKGATSDPRGKSPGNYPSTAGSAGATSQPQGGPRTPSMTRKGNARKV